MDKDDLDDTASTAATVEDPDSPIDFFSLDEFEFDFNDDVDNDNYSSPRLRPSRRRRLSPPPPPPSISLPERLFLVPFRWFEEANSDKLRGEAYRATSKVQEIQENGLWWSEIVMLLERECTTDVDGDDDEGKRFTGKEYALVSETMWFKALRWHSDVCSAFKSAGSSLAAEDIFPIQIRLYVRRKSVSLMVKISDLDNPFEHYKSACEIFAVHSDLLRFWDFSGQITQFFEGDNAVILKGYQGKSNQQVSLEIHVYNLPEFTSDVKAKIVVNEIEESSLTLGSSSRWSFKMNGAGEDNGSLQSDTGGNGQIDLLGLTGLVNLGNTCFMNSAIQCLSHTPKLVDFFLVDYRKEINYVNPLGMKGDLALAFGDLLRKLWSPGRVPITPRSFKSTLENFAPQFKGYNQHDSQEFLAFLLDGLHEDLNRVKLKPFIQARDAEGRLDHEMADECWRNHLARNDSIIVDLCTVSVL